MSPDGDSDMVEQTSETSTAEIGALVHDSPFDALPKRTMQLHLLAVTRIS